MTGEHTVSAAMSSTVVSVASHLTSLLVHGGKQRRLGAIAPLTTANVRHVSDSSRMGAVEVFHISSSVVLRIHDRTLGLTSHTGWIPQLTYR